MGYGLATRAQVLALKAFGGPKSGHRRPHRGSLASRPPDFQSSACSWLQPYAAVVQNPQLPLGGKASTTSVTLHDRKPLCGSSTSPVESIDTTVRGPITSPSPVCEALPPVSPPPRPPASRFLLMFPFFSSSTRRADDLALRPTPGGRAGVGDDKRFTFGRYACRHHSYDAHQAKIDCQKIRH